MLQSYRELKVWQAAMALAGECHGLAARFPAQERFAMADQVRRAAGSIPANVAEGYARAHRGDYLRHLSYAAGSLAELETHLLLARRLAYISQAELARAFELCDVVSRMLRVLRRRLAVHG